MTGYYSNEERKILLDLARNTIVKYIEDGIISDFNTDNNKFLEKRGVFVTLHKSSSLRGCIGYPLPIKILKTAVIDNSISAAFEDPRFPPVLLNEINDIEIEISVLTVPQRVNDPNEVNVGKDGIIISNGHNRGLLLPQVPVEQGWDLDEYLSYGCMKAGLPKDLWKNGAMIETFQAEVFSEKDFK